MTKAEYIQTVIEADRAQRREDERLHGWAAYDPTAGLYRDREVARRAADQYDRDSLRAAGAIR